MPQGLSNYPATFNYLVTQLFIPHRGYIKSDYNNSLGHSRAMSGQSDLKNDADHLRDVLECMRTNKLYAYTSKCIFGAEQNPFLGYSIEQLGLRVDPAKVKTIDDWPVPQNPKDLRKYRDLFNYLHMYSEKYANMASPLFNLLKRMSNGVGIATQTLLLKQLRRVSFRHRVWICEILSGLLVQFVTLLTLPLVALYFRYIPMVMSALSRMNLASRKRQRRTNQFIPRNYLQ